MQEEEEEEAEEIEAEAKLCLNGFDILIIEISEETWLRRKKAAHHAKTSNVSPHLLFIGHLFAACEHPIDLKINGIERYESEYE